MNELLKAALRYAELGYRVVPLVARDKKPRLPSWTTHASTQRRQIETWWKAWPDANIGLMPPEGCIVVDVDPRNGGDAAALLFNRATPTQRTGGGGSHFVVRVGKDVQLPKLDGIDYIRPGRQQFVAWPSVHPDGGRYEWIDGFEPWSVEPAEWLSPVAAIDEALSPIPLYAPNPTRTHLQTLDVAKTLLDALPADMYEYPRWIDVGQALKHVFGDEAYGLWDEWSQRDPQGRYKGGAETEDKWRTLDRNRDRPPVSWGTLVHHALRGGWQLSPELAPDAADLWAARTAPPLSPGCLPPSLLSWVDANARVTGFDPVGYALAAAIAVTSAVHHNVRVQPIAGNATFREPPLLWGVVVGTSGTGKSCILGTASKTHELRTAELYEHYAEAIRDWNALPKEDRPSKPDREFVLLKDTTQEKLEERLSVQTSNTLVLHDELAMFFEAMQRYSKGAVRGAVLAMWNGGPHTVERIGRPEVFIRYYGACVLGSTQVDTFTKWFASETGDGMLPRFLPVVDSWPARASE